MDKTDTYLKAEALIQMYQSGFLDGYKEADNPNAKYNDIVDKCKKAFERRFIKQVEGFIDGSNIRQALKKKDKKRNSKRNTKSLEKGHKRSN